MKQPGSHDGVVIEGLKKIASKLRRARASSDSTIKRHTEAEVAAGAVDFAMGRRTGLEIALAEIEALIRSAQR